jgi:hypothetical protein
MFITLIPTSRYEIQFTIGIRPKQESKHITRGRAINEKARKTALHQLVRGIKSPRIPLTCKIEDAGATCSINDQLLSPLQLVVEVQRETAVDRFVHSRLG